MITTSQIRDKVNSYLRRDISVDEFEDWLVLQSWNMQEDSTKEARRLVGAIEACLYKYADNQIDQMSLREELRKLIEKGD